MASYTKLRDELVNDPLDRGYDNMNNAEKAADLNTAYVEQINQLSSEALLAWAGGGADDGNSIVSRFERIEDASVEHASGAIRGACKAAIKMISRDDTYLDLNNSVHVTMLNGIVAGGVITSDEKDDLVALATSTVTRAQALGLGKVLVGHVKKALA